jgi:indole-3-glycerol phosphate synthase
METILSKIVKQKKKDERLNFRNFSSENFQLIDRSDPIDILPLLKREFFVIAEIKRASPSKGKISREFNPQDIAPGYEKAGASAISVITESNFFLGKKEYLSMVKNTVDLPILRKDFLVHPFQIYESFNLGADMILLIAACLSDTQIKNLYSLSLSLGMQVIIEVHNRNELIRVLKLKPAVIGINNRDLKTFRVSLQTSFDLKEEIPDNIFVISESGISSSEEIKRLKLSGFAGVLIGESLLRDQNPGKRLGQLLGNHLKGEE